MRRQNGQRVAERKAMSTADKYLSKADMVRLHEKKVAELTNECAALKREVSKLRQELAAARKSRRMWQDEAKRKSQ